MPRSARKACRSCFANATFWARLRRLRRFVLMASGNGGERPTAALSNTQPRTLLSGLVEHPINNLCPICVESVAAFWCSICGYEDARLPRSAHHDHRGRRFGPAAPGRRPEVGRSLRARDVDGAGDRRADRQHLCARARAGGRHHAGRRSRRAVRPRRRHSGGGGVRSLGAGLQLDGLSRQRRVRRVLHGHDRLRPLDAPGTHERSVQSLARATETVRAGADQRAVRGRLSQPTHEHRLRLERHQWGRRLHSRPPQGRAGQPRGVVAGWTTRRRLRGPASGKSPGAGAVGAGL